MKSSGVVGLPICLKTSEQISAVKLVVFDPEQHHTLGFLVSWGGWAGSARVLPWSEYLRVTDKSIEIPSISLIVAVNQIPLIRNILEGASLAKGTLITTVDRHMVGVLHDVYFDPATGAVRQYEIIFTSWGAAGQRMFITPEQVTFDPAEGTLVVPMPVAAQMEEAVRNSD